MIAFNHIPISPLNKYIESFYYYEGYTPDHSIDRFLPDGNTEMVIDLNDKPQFIYDNETLKEIQSCHNVWVSGIRTEPMNQSSNSIPGEDAIFICPDE